MGNGAVGSFRTVQEDLESPSDYLNKSSSAATSNTVRLEGGVWRVKPKSDGDGRWANRAGAGERGNDPHAGLLLSGPSSSSQLWEQGDSFDVGYADQPSIGDFDLLEVIGQGGFAKVWKAKLPRSERCYAIKIQSLRDVKKSAKKMAQIRTEREILTSMDSPFVVKLHWALENGDSTFLVLDYIPGGTLFQLQSAQPGQVFGLQDTEFYLMEVFLGVAHLHRNHVCFRDLKPENLLIDSAGHVVLSDFGLSKIGLDETMRNQSILGTPEYMAPEVVTSKSSGKGYSYEIDYWALGCLAYECLHGQSPFNFGSVKDTFRAVIVGKHHPISHKLPISAHELIQGLLAVDPALRVKEAEFRAMDFFSTYSWEDIERKVHPSPLHPSDSRETETLPNLTNDRDPQEKTETDRLSYSEFNTECNRGRAVTFPMESAVKITGEAAQGSILRSHRMLLEKFVEMRSESCLDRERWAEILDERFMYTLPSSVYRAQTGMFSDGGHLKVLVGIDSLLHDLEAGRFPLPHVGGGHITGEVKYSIDTVISSGNEFVWSGYAESIHVPAKGTIIVSMKVSSDGKLVKAEQAMDVLGFGKQLEQHSQRLQDSKAASEPRVLTVLDYDFLVQCGAGQFGRVWKARAIEHRKGQGKCVAIKVQMKDQQFSKTTGADRAITEKRLQSRLSHPFIVQLYATFHTRTHLFFVMAFATRGSLRDAAEQHQGRFSTDLVKFFAAEVCLALQYIHDNNIIFRDLKPENVVICSDGHLKLIDFGLAFEGSEFQSFNAEHVGNYEYAAPEYLLGVVCGPQVDWWAFGCFVFELAVGAAPFGAENMEDRHARICSGGRHEMEGMEGTVVSSFVDALCCVDVAKRLGHHDVCDHPFFSDVNWTDVMEKQNPPPQIVGVESFASAGSDRPSSRGNAASTTSWQLEQARLFFQLRTERCTDRARWQEVVEDIFVFCTPFLPYRNMAASEVDPTTQLQFAVGIDEFIQDIQKKKSSRNSQVSVELYSRKFLATEERAIGGLNVSFGNMSVKGAAKMVFSVDKKLTRLETCFDLHAFMVKMTEDAATQSSSSISSSSGNSFPESRQDEPVIVDG